MKKAYKNVTLSLPEPMLRRFRIFAAERNQSMTKLMADAIDRMLDEGDREKAKQRILDRLKNPPSLGTNGVIPWTRDEIHDRGVR